MQALLPCLIVQSVVAIAPVQAAQPDIDPVVASAIQPVSAAIAEVNARLAKLPPARDDAERLVRMGELEQAPRAALSKVDFSKLSEAQKRQAWAAITAQLKPIDEENQRALLRMVPEDGGWFSISRYGRDAARAAFLIIQHSNQDLWRRFLPSIERMAKAGEAEGPSYALLYDRLALSEGRPQRYGSQMECRGGRYVPQEPLEDPSTLDARRAALKMIPYAEYLRMFDENSC